VNDFPRRRVDSKIDQLDEIIDFYTRPYQEEAATAIDSVFYEIGEGYPAMWRVDINGDFPETDPVNFGAADDGTGREARGLSRCCSGVMVTDTAMCFEQYEDGTWVGPSHVAFPDGEHRELPGAGLYYRNTSVWGINDFGQIVGSYELGGGIWQLNADRTISSPISLGNFFPKAINNFGVMAGTYGGWPTIAWFEGEALMIEQLDTSPEFWGADVNALNDCPVNDERLTVVGTSLRDETGDFSAPDRGFAWRPCDAANPTSILGTLGGWESRAFAVNTRGEIVGMSDTKNRGQQAFIFKDGMMSNLNSMADVGRNRLKFALGINDDGDIVGFMGIPRPVSEQHGFLLRPIPEPPPE
jgi:probable HAF family extracellular repeat protein